MAGTIQGSAEALLTVLNDILDLSKIEAGKQELEQLPFSLMRCVQDCAMLLHGNAEQKGLELMTFVDPRLWQRHLGDAARIRQVVLNLLGNATKFTLKGEIVVGVDVLAEDDKAQVVSISVRDTGIGISQEAIKRLFVPFAQADASTTRRFGGTGLGLAISASSLLGLMGGTDRAYESSAGRTARRFYIERTADHGAGSRLRRRQRVAKARSPECGSWSSAPHETQSARILTAATRRLAGDLHGRWPRTPPAALRLMLASAAAAQVPPDLVHAGIEQTSARRSAPTVLVCAAALRNDPVAPAAGVFRY